MKVANLDGLAVETATATRRAVPHVADRSEFLVERYALIALMMRAGWDWRAVKRQLRISRRSAFRLIREVRAFKEACAETERDAA